MGAVIGDEWTSLTGVVPARIKPTVGNEQWLQESLHGVTQFDVTIRVDRFTKLATTADSLVNMATGERYDITFIANLDERNRFLVLNCVSGTAVG